MVISSCAVDALGSWLSGFERRHLDLGTGDGRFALELAKANPEMAVLGVDTCLDHVRVAVRKQPANLRFVTVAAQEFLAPDGVTVKTISINFPYGSLLRSLVEADPALMAVLESWLGPDGRIEVRINAQALAGTRLDVGDADQRIARALSGLPGVAVGCEPIEQAQLRTFPSIWAKRLGFGKPTRAWLIEAVSKNGVAPGTTPCVYAPRSVVPPHR